MCCFSCAPLLNPSIIFPAGDFDRICFTAYRFGGEKTARLLAGVTALRMLIAFFSLFGSLLYTGVGLIVSGLVILGIAYGCLRADAYLKLNAAGKGKNNE